MHEELDQEFLDLWVLGHCKPLDKVADPNFGVVFLRIVSLTMYWRTSLSMFFLTKKRLLPIPLTTQGTNTT